MTRLPRFILVASLSLNLALGAGLGWLAWHSNQAAPEPQTRSARALFHSETLRRALPPERGAVVDRVLAHHRDTMRAHIDELTQARAGVREAILAEPFTRQGLDEAFARLRAAEGDTAQEAHALLADLVEQAEPQEREHLARLIPARGKHRRRHSRHRPQPERSGPH